MSHSQANQQINRRRFLQKSVLAVSGAAVLPAAITACRSAAEDPVPEFAPAGNYGFFEGVASFDPIPDRVMLWTRYTPADNEPASPYVLLEVAEDPGFTKTIVNELMEINEAEDYTVRVDVGNLKSNTKYFYRFKNEQTGAVSATGETKTLPSAGESDNIRFAFASCANFEKGYFNVYGAIAKSSADFVLHLGDYIYEGSVGEKAIMAGDRIHEPPREILTKDDYRQRYRQYRRDEQLQELHRIKPFICIWDDHEFSNNTYKNGAAGHDENEGSFELRKSSAMEAWHEYLFARTEDPAIIYRKFDLGGMASLFTADTRIAGRDKQLDYSKYIKGDQLDLTSFDKDWKNPNRSILGKKQLNLLKNEIKSNGNKRMILAGQVIMAKHLLPAELIPIVHKYRTSGSITDEQKIEYYKLIEELIEIKNNINKDKKVSESERARVENVLPYNLDAWDGYPEEREAIFAALPGNKLISLAGASHNAWFSELSNSHHEKKGIEIAAPSVTSAGLDGFFGNDPVISALVERANVALMDDVKYLDASRRGFVEVKLTPGEISAEWKFVRTVSEVDTETVTGHQITEI